MFLKRINEDGCSVRMDKKLRMEMNVRNSLDAAIVEDLKSAGEIAELDEYVSSEDERTKTANQMT